MTHPTIDMSHLPLERQKRVEGRIGNCQINPNGKEVVQCELRSTPSVPKKASQLCLDTEVCRHVLAIYSSVSRKGCEAFLGTEGVLFLGGTKKKMGSSNPTVIVPWEPGWPQTFHH
jgi:hypothetical protein